MRKLYYVFDSVADNYVYFCEAASDAVALRSFQYSCRNDFAPVANDLALYCLGTFENGNIVPDHVLIGKYGGGTDE